MNPQDHKESLVGKRFWVCDPGVGAGWPTLHHVEVVGTVNGHTLDPALACRYLDPPETLTYEWHSRLWPTKREAVQHAIALTEEKVKRLREFMERETSEEN